MVNHFIFLCGTKKVLMDEKGRFRVVCATCGAGGSVPHTKNEATKACVRDSIRKCANCGAD
jgi:hypothetical protein